MGPLARIGFSSPVGRRPGGDETGALREALDAAARDLAALCARKGPDAAAYLEFQVALLEDETLIAHANSEIDRGQAADAGWRSVMEGLIRAYAADPSPYVQARTLDVADLRDRVLKALHFEPPEAAPPAGAIVVAEDLAPSRFLEIDWSRGGAIALSRGSAMSHTAILAGAFGVPMIVQAGDIPPAATALLDADHGVLELDPADGAETAVAGRNLRPSPGAAYADLAAPATYRGERVHLLLNIEGPESLAHPAAKFADGVGLMRTEFLFLGRGQAPDEDAQCESYTAVLRWAAGRPVTIRTVDAGGDKAISGLSAHGEANPFMGVRGLRLSLQRPELFTTQLRALARAAATGPLKVMFPMVTTPAEFEAARGLFQQAVAALRAQGRAARLPELGMMVEVPAAALTISSFEAGFFSIGANDLTQFVMACDRANGALSHLHDPMHPAVRELSRGVIAHGRAHGKSVSLCGDVAAQPAHALLLLQDGLRELSMSANALAAVKRALLAGAEAHLV